MALKINSDKKGIKINIHLPRKHFFFLLVVFLIIIFAVVGYFAYRYYTSTTTYTNKKELQGFNYNPPADIKKEIKKIQNHPQPTPVTNLGQLLPTTKIASISGTIRVPILMYHYIEYVQNKKDTLRIALNITPYTLDQQIQTLINAGYTFMTNNDLDDVLDGLKPLPAKPILLTFDDGYRDFATDAYPILKKYNVKATAYVVPGFLDKPNNMLRSQLDQIAHDGLVEIAAHTVDHIGLSRQSLKVVTDEVFRSKLLLQDEIKNKVTDFAYPYGSFDDQAIQVVKEAGFRSATSTLPGIEQGQINRYFMFRLRPGYRIGETLLNWLNQTKFSAY